MPEIEELIELLNEKKRAIAVEADRDESFREKVNLCLDLRAYRISRALRDAGFEEAALFVSRCTVESMPFFSEQRGT